MTVKVDRPQLLFINRSYWPDVEATGQLLTELCEDLATDFDVTVICGRSQKIVERLPADAERHRERHGVRIRRVWHTQFDKASFIGRVANMLTFQVAATWSALNGARPDVVVSETDPPFLCVLGSLVKRLRGCRHVCYLQDIYPDVAVALGKLGEGTRTRLLRRLFFNEYRRSDAVIALSSDMRKLLVDGGVPAEKVAVIPNWVDTEAVYPVKWNNRFRRLHDLQHRFVVMYSGNMGMSQRLDLVVEAAERLRDREDIVFAMVGDGADRSHLERLAMKRRLANVRFFDYQPKGELADSLSAADLHLVILRPEVQQLLMPSKLYGVLASGTPAIVLADPRCELASTVADHELGTVVAPDSSAELADAVCRYAESRTTVERQSAAARAFAETNCRRDTSISQLHELLKKLCRFGSEVDADPCRADHRATVSESIVRTSNGGSYT